MATILDSTFARRYRELLRIANAIIRSRPWVSAAPSSLVHDSFLRLKRADLSPESDLHFRRLAAKTMTYVLLDRARKRARARLRHSPEGGQQAEAPDLETAADQEELTAFSLALEALREVDPKAAAAFELECAGYTLEEIASELGLSVGQVRRCLERARRWLAGRMRVGADDDEGDPRE